MASRMLKWATVSPNSIDKVPTQTSIIVRGVLKKGLPKIIRADPWENTSSYQKHKNQQEK